MANDAQNALLSAIFANTGVPVAGSQPEDDGSFAPVLDPEVRKRLQLGFKMAQENPKMAKEVAANTPPQVMGLPSASNPATRNFSVSGNFLTPEDRARRQEMEIQFKELLAQQQAGIDKQDQAIMDMKQSAKPEWVTPAAAFLDQTYGGNQAEAAKAWSGMSAQERAKAIQEMEQAQNQQRASMSNQVKSLIDSNNTLRMAEIADKNTRFAQGQDMRLNMAFNRDVQTANKTAWETMQQIQPIEAALAPDANGNVDIARVTQALSQASRLMGERGVLTDQDIERVHKSTIDQRVAEIQGWITSNPSQPVPARIVAPLAAAIQDGKASMQRLMQARLNTLRDAYVKGYGMRPEVGDTVVNQVYLPQFNQGFGGQVPGAAPAQAPSAPKKIMSRDEFRKARGK